MFARSIPVRRRYHGRTRIGFQKPRIDAVPNRASDGACIVRPVDKIDHKISVRSRPRFDQIEICHLRRQESEKIANGRAPVALSRGDDPVADWAIELLDNVRSRTVAVAYHFSAEHG